MKTRKPRTNSFSGAARPANVSPIRQAAEDYLLNHPGTHTREQIAQAIGEPPDAIRKKLAGMVSDGSIINLRPGKANPIYQHATHWREAHERALRANPHNLVQRREPITNSRMPNGDRAFWRAWMARFNEPPRVAQA